MKDYRFGNFLSELRERSGLSQYQLGSLVGVSNKAVSKWENGLARPNSKVLPKLSSVLGVTADELLACKYNTSTEREDILAMKNSIWEKSFENMKELYGETVPIQVLNRYESEKAELEKTDLILYFMLLSKIIAKSKALGEQILVRGDTGASFVAYLLGAVNINPLSPHYVCPKCRKTDFVQSVADGWDLSPKECDCGHMMKRMGHQIPFSLYKNRLLEKNRFDVSVSNAFHQHIYQVIAECCTELSVTIKEDTHSEESKSFTVFPTNLGDSKVDSTKCFTIFVLPFGTLDLCRKLQKCTNTSMEHVNFLDSQVLARFQMPDTDDIIEFSSEYAKHMIKELHPQKFSHLLKISGLSHSSGAWETNERELMLKNTIRIDDIIAYRDDVYNTIYSHMLKMGYTETGIANWIAEKMRKGGLPQQEDYEETEKIMTMLNLPKWYLDALKKITYLFPKAHGISYVQLALILMWYKVNYSELYLELFGKPCNKKSYALI